MNVAGKGGEQRWWAKGGGEKGAKGEREGEREGERMGEQRESEQKAFWEAELYSCMYGNQCQTFGGTKGIKEG